MLNGTPLFGHPVGCGVGGGGGVGGGLGPDVQTLTVAFHKLGLVLSIIVAWTYTFRALGKSPNVSNICVSPWRRVAFR